IWWAIFFFFQAEDGIRDRNVTGVQTCALPILVEALVAGSWMVVDSTHLAPRASMVRIATGQDAADTAFMTTLAGNVLLTGIQVSAVVDPQLPVERPAETLSLR